MKRASVFSGRLALALAFAATLSLSASAMEQLPPGVHPSDPLLQSGCLDVTRPPYEADPSGAQDATEAIQRAVNDARDHGLVCFFPEGTYLISDTISCEQKVAKLDKPRHVDGGTQHYWPVHQPIVLMGSTKGKRPVLKLSPDAKGFNDPANPKLAVRIWAQTWFDAPGKEEPVWGKEQANISFNHFFRGIDLDIRGHAGAVGIRHSGSQGSTMQDVTILAEGAHAGLNCCPGQGGGTYNVRVTGGSFGIVLEPDSRFPILTGCEFEGQTKACIRYARGGSQVPTLLAGCRLAPAAPCAVDFTTEKGYAGISLVECVVELPPGGVICKTGKPENIFLEDTLVRGAESVRTGGGPLPSPGDWTRIDRYSSHKDGAVNLVNGELGAGEIARWTAKVGEPDFAAIRAKHYSPGPSFEDADAANVRDYGARGDGSTDDTGAFVRAIAARDKVFVSHGHFVLSGTLRLRPGTHLFGLHRSFSSIGAPGDRRSHGEPGPSPEADSFTLETVDAPEAAPGLSFLTVRGRVAWRSGRGTWMLPRAAPTISGNGGGRFYGLMAMGRPLILEGIRQPTAFYALNVERVNTNPQAEFRDCSQLRLYYFKVESGTIQHEKARDGNTPARITGSKDVRVYCMYGNVRKLEGKPMLEVVDSRDIAVSQLKAFFPGEFPHLTEVAGGKTQVVPSSETCALFVREADRE